MLIEAKEFLKRTGKLGITPDNLTHTISQLLDNPIPYNIAKCNGFFPHFAISEDSSVGLVLVNEEGIKDENVMYSEAFKVIKIIAH